VQAWPLQWHTFRRLPDGSMVCPRENQIFTWRFGAVFPIKECRIEGMPNVRIVSVNQLGDSIFAFTEGGVYAKHRRDFLPK
jgi:hypothetical protein